MKTFSTIEFNTKKQAKQRAELMKSDSYNDLKCVKTEIKKTINNRWVVVGTYLE